MKKQKPQIHRDENREKNMGSKSITMKKNNKKRLGGAGLSLQAFANAKSKDFNYNPAFIKKQREFYKNAKYVNKYKKSLKQQTGQQNHPSTVTRLPEVGDETGAGRKVNKNKKNNFQSLKDVYENKIVEEEKVRKEKEAMIQAKKEERDRAEAQRKTQREKMFKKTRSGQPVMKYRIEHLLKSIQGSTD